MAKGFDYQSVIGRDEMIMSVVQAQLDYNPIKKRIRINEIQGRENLHRVDGFNLVLDLERSERMTKKILKSVREIEYGEISKENGDENDPWPDCDDYTGEARTLIMRHARKNKWRRPPVFGFIEYEYTEGGLIKAHQQDWELVIDRRGGGAKPMLRLYEPQNDTRKDDFGHITRIREMTY